MYPPVESLKFILDLWLKSLWWRTFVGSVFEIVVYTDENLHLSRRYRKKAPRPALGLKLPPV
jgi:hypothetical protein